ncbi:hypothetical protein TomTYG75_27120 [Sphingobium sp. TomTYG75]
MLTWYITRGDVDGTQAEIGWRGRKLRWASLDRDEAEQANYLAHGDWLEVDGRWLAYHRERQANPAYHHWARFGIAFGKRFWLWAAEWPNAAYDMPEAEAARERDAVERRTRLARATR